MRSDASSLPESRDVSDAPARGGPDSGPPPTSSRLEALSADVLVTALFGQSPMSVALYDVAGRVAAGNAAYERHFGVRVSEVPADWSLFTDPQLATAGLTPLIRRAYAGEVVTLPPVRYDAAAATGGPGRVVWTQGYCYPVRGGGTSDRGDPGTADGAGAVTHLAVLHVDVTAWAEAEAALARANVQLRDEAATRAAVLGQLAEGVIATDAAGRITFVNEAAAQLHGVARLDVAPEAYAETYHLMTLDGQPYPSAELPLARAVLRGETVRDASWRIRRPDGSEVVAVGSARPVRGPDGAAVGAVLTLRDDTARAAAESALRASNVELAGQNAQLQAQALELELANQQLQDQATELELQAEALQATAVELEERTEDAERARQLAEAERARAAGILEAMADAYFALDAEFRIVAVNAAMARATGLARDALLGRVFWEVFPGTVGTAYERHYRAAATQGTPAHFTDAYDDGRLALVSEADVYPVAGGGVAVFWRDITARVQAEAALRESEARYRDLFTSIDEGFCVLEVLFEEDRPVDYRFLEANPAFAEQTGLVNAVGRTARELVPGLEQHWIDTYGRVATTGESTRFELGSDVMGRWFDVFAFRTGRPEERRVALLFTDVSAAKVAEHERARLGRELAMERERLAYVFQQAPSFLAVLRGPDHVFTLVNEAYYQLVGHREILGQPAFDALPEVREQGFRELLDGVLVTGEPFIGREMPLLVQRTPGAPPEERYVDLAYMPLVEAEDVRDAEREAADEPRPLGRRVTGVIAHGSDVTAQVLARREAEQLLGAAERARREAEAARQEADEANQAKSGFLATMSHELRTPINAMIGYTQLLDLGLAGPLTEQQRDYLARLAASSQHLLGLVNHVLDLSKIEAGETRVAHQDAWTGAAIQAALDLVRPQAHAGGVRLVDERPSDKGVPYVGDEDRVRQILANLLSNAVKFTARGGTVTVGCGRMAETPASAGHLHGEGPWAYVRVTDTGVGIPPEEHARIFDPFHQVAGANAYTRTHGGTGLGLAISRRLARLLGGDLLVESTPGEGSAFTLWLPSARRATDGRPAGSPEGAADDAAIRPDEAAAERGVRAERDDAQLPTPGLGEVGDVLRASVDDVLATYADRLRTDPAIPRGRELRRRQLEDHAISFLADLAQSLVIVGEAGAEAADLLRDGSAIQRTIAEQHGARRHAQGFDEAGVRSDHRLLRDSVERAVRGRLRSGSADVEAAVQVLLRLLDRAEALSVRAWREAAQRADDPAAGEPTTRSA